MTDFLAAAGGGGGRHVVMLSLDASRHEIDGDRAVCNATRWRIVAIVQARVVADVVAKIASGDEQRKPTRESKGPRISRVTSKVKRRSSVATKGGAKAKLVGQACMWL